MEAKADRNSKAREKIVNVARQDDAAPTDPRSKLVKQAEIKTKVIDENEILSEVNRDPDFQSFLDQNKWKTGSETKVGQSFTFGGKSDAVRAGEGPYQVYQRLSTQKEKPAVPSSTPSDNGPKPTPKDTTPTATPSAADDSKSGNSPLAAGIKSYDRDALDKMNDKMSADQQALRDRSYERSIPKPQVAASVPSDNGPKPSPKSPEPSQSRDSGGSQSAPAKSPEPSQSRDSGGSQSAPDSGDNERLKSTYDLTDKFADRGRETMSPLTGTRAGTSTRSFAGDMANIGIDVKSKKDTVKESILRVINSKDNRKQKDEELLFGKGPPDNMPIPPSNVNGRIDTSMSSPKMPRIDPAKDAALLGITKTAKMPSVYDSWPFAKAISDEKVPAVKKSVKESILKVTDPKANDARKIMGGQTQIDLNPKTDDRPEIEQQAKKKPVFKSNFNAPIKEQDSHYGSAGTSLHQKEREAKRRRDDLEDKSQTRAQMNKLKPKMEEEEMSDAVLTEKELAALEEIAASFSEGKKIKEGSNKPTVGNQAGEKGDQSGENPKNSTARYDISDEVVVEKLVGGQKNLDKNHNGKIDAEDFKLLKKSKMKEEVEMTILSAEHIERFNAVLEAEAVKRGRGRPKKNPEGDEPRPEGRDPRQHIQVIAGQAGAGRVIDFKHDDGSSTKITAPMGRSIVAHLNNLKPKERHDAVQSIHGSAGGLKKTMGI
jgi:hypothetical protein